MCYAISEGDSVVLSWDQITDLLIHNFWADKVTLVVPIEDGDVYVGASVGFWFFKPTVRGKIRIVLCPFLSVCLLTESSIYQKWLLLRSSYGILEPTLSILKPRKVALVVVSTSDGTDVCKVLFPVRTEKPGDAKLSRCSFESQNIFDVFWYAALVWNLHVAKHLHDALSPFFIHPPVVTIVTPPALEGIWEVLVGLAAELITESI